MKWRLPETMSDTITQPCLQLYIPGIYENSNFGFGQSAREEAIRQFKLLKMPTSKTEEYRFTPATRLLERSFGEHNFTETPEAKIDSIEQFLIPGLLGNVVVLVNGQYSEKLSTIISPSDQVSIGSLENALKDYETVKNNFGTLVTSSQDVFAAMNTALWTAGVHIHVPANKRVEAPVLILHLTDTTENEVVSQTRVFAHLEEGSEVTIIEKYSTVGSYAVFNNIAQEIQVDKNAILNYYKIQNDEVDNYHISNTRIHQNDASRVNTFTLTTEGDLVRNNLGIIINGEGCESHFYGLYLLKGDTIADNHTVVDHQKPNSFSNELYKGIMDGKSKGVFNGKIFVRPHAQKTNAFQSNRNILLSDSSSINTKPQLEIWADDVKCSHGCTSGQLDEEAIFYLQSRGIAKQTARAMVLNAFAGEVFAAAGDPVMKSYMENLVSMRLESII